MTGMRNVIIDSVHFPKFNLIIVERRLFLDIFRALIIGQQL